MESLTICRCCLTEGPHRDLNSAYTWHDNKEIYSDMLHECFNIVLCTLQGSSRVICDKCIEKLRDAITFKRQVLCSEEMFIKIYNSKKVEDASVKMEPKSEENSNDSDNFFLAHMVKDDIDNEIEPRKSKVKKRNESCAKKKLLIHTDCDKKSPRMKKAKQINLLANDMHIESVSKITAEKMKHKENLLTVLKYSNAMPFKNRSLLGFICSYCDATYRDPTDLRRHTEDHKKERLELRTHSDLTEYHVKLDIADLTCLLCEQKLDNLAILKDHLIKKHNKFFHMDIKDHIMQFRLRKGDVFDCAMCSSRYETFKMLKQHMNQHYDNYICPKCGSTFATKRSLHAHKATHIEGSFKCDLCEKVFPSRTKKLYHEKTKHLGNRSISNCPFCDAAFRSYYQRNQHMVKVHNSEAQYKCNICNKAYILKSLLMYHIKKNHLMERNFQCTECGYKFFSKKALKAHMIKHTGERKYACEVCHKSYARKYTLREHMRIHNNDRRFKCDLCGNAFVQKCSLKSHLLSHHGISMAASEITVS
ncbi:gastrula zinc finger protein XlCGF57.1-like [Zerene cesonia]|uniref:gastrula zinc finger protein XlCGF57.1-like n=1 Tax=Zerene cesonia TaxID=33412 RepID=UPI0018E57A07|nr:gastrula zinc finger protein XlCGF57.1-like [Zerene cesonia]